MVVGTIGGVVVGFIVLVGFVDGLVHPQLSFYGSSDIWSDD